MITLLINWSRRALYRFLYLQITLIISVFMNVYSFIFNHPDFKYLFMHSDQVDSPSSPLLFQYLKSLLNYFLIYDMKTLYINCEK